MSRSRERRCRRPTFPRRTPPPAKPAAAATETRRRPGSAAIRIFTIGYEGTTVGEFLSALTAAGVERLIDVRAVPNSRRPGFSKTPLSSALAQEGVEYVHLRALGTPAAGRAAARAGRHAELKRIYAGQLELPEAIAQGAQMLDLAREKPSALLCYERDPAGCHRSLLLAAVAPDAEVVHLYA